MSTLVIELGKLRGYLNDESADHQVRGEDTGQSRLNPGVIERGGKVFHSLETNLVDAKTNVSVDDQPYIVFPGGGESIDLVLGRLTFSDTTKPRATLLVSYQFQWFTDAQLNQFLNNGVEFLQWYGDGSASTDIEAVPIGLLVALRHYAAHEACNRLWQKYSEAYDASVEGQSANVASVAQRFKEQAEKELVLAEKLRDDWGKGSGKAAKPATRFFRRPYIAYTPRR